MVSKVLSRARGLIFQPQKAFSLLTTCHLEFNSQQTTGDTMKKVCDNLPEDYQFRLAMAELNRKEQDAERLRLSNIKEKMNIEDKQAIVCYKATVEAEVNKALSTIATVLKSGSQQICTMLNLSAKEGAKVEAYFNDVLRTLSQIDVNLSTTEEIDAANAHATLVEKEIRKSKATRAKTSSNSKKSK